VLFFFNGGIHMAIAKVIQVISEGKTVDEAIANAVKEVAKTV
jgi:hypothetical protein